MKIMLKKFHKYYLFAIPILLLSILIGCRNVDPNWDNFTTYFNTYYNADRLMKKAEDEFGYQNKKQRVEPTILVPDTAAIDGEHRNYGPPDFCKEFIISEQIRQPVDIALDSVLIKGSKVLAHHPKSYYVQGMLFLMAKSYFYRNEWIPSQIKCSELIDKYPDGDFSPDAHLLLSKNLLIQRKFYAGKIMLSRTVDIAWQKRRYDILSEAFRLEADLALYQHDLEGALKPYQQAILQSDDGQWQAKWQFDLAGLIFRMGKFERAASEFEKVHDFSPTYLTEFEADLYRASCMARIGQYEDAEELLEDLENDGKYEEWVEYVHIEQMRLLYLRGDKEKLYEAEKKCDSLYVNNKLLSGYYYEKAKNYYENNNYGDARWNYSKAKMIKSPVYKVASIQFQLLTKWENTRKEVMPILINQDTIKTLGDTAKMQLAYNLFSLGRVHTQLGNPDSARHYYELAVEYSPKESQDAARLIYVYARSIYEINPYKSDSLMLVLIENYPKTDYGKDAMDRMGYTKAFLIDTVAELYTSGYELKTFGDFEFALIQFKKIYKNYPESPYAPRSLYAIGWIYEKDLNVIDSAYYYYKLLIEKYPNSEYAEDVRKSIQYIIAYNSEEDVPDSLKDRKLVEFKPREIDMHAPGPGNTIQAPGTNAQDQQVQPQDIINNPKKILNKAKDFIKNPFKKAKDEYEKAKEKVKDEYDKAKEKVEDEYEKAKDKVDEVNKQLNPSDSTKSNKDIKNPEEDEKKKSDSTKVE